MTARGAANALTRATAILAVAFFATSLALSIIARYASQPIDILDRVPAPGGGAGVLDQLGGSTTPPAGGDAATPPATDAAPAAPDAAPAAPQAAPATDAAPAKPAEPAAPAEPAVPNQ